MEEGILYVQHEVGADLMMKRSDLNVEKGRDVYSRGYSDCLVVVE